MTWVSRRSDGRAVEGAKLDYRLRDWGGEKERLRLLKPSTTDATGLSRFALPDAADDGEVSTLVRHAEEVALVEDAYPRFDRDDVPVLVAYIYTDRPVYRPGQTVHYSAALRTFEAGEVAKAMHDRVIHGKS